jgi:glycosyltransferase involved in cell wall biosynthesis
MTNPMIPSKFTNVTDAPVKIGKHTIIGASSVILPGVSIGECCSVGSLSLVKESIEEGWIVAGSPSKKIKRRSLKLKEIEKQYLESLKPQVSVAISCYNFSNYIEKCIKSIQSQVTNFNFEIIIADDCSQDGTLDILNELSKNDPRIKILKSEKNIGAYENIKRLYESCSGKYIAFIDGDDYFTDNYKLQKQFDFLESNPECVLHCTGYKIIDDEGNTSPQGDVHLIPLKDIVTIEDIIDKNYITFGKMFRNIKDLVPEWSSEIEFLDWSINFETLKYGYAKCEEWCSGMYRVNGKGMITSKSEDHIQNINNKVRVKLKEKYFEYKSVKFIAIVDSFVNKKEVESKLIECLDRLNEDGIPVLLISNTKIKSEFLQKVDYFLYDNRNQLFTSDKYSGIRDIDIWKANESFEAHEIKSGLQKHGLSVLINLYNSLNYAKSLGYTHFFRFEVDDEFGKKSREFIKKVPNLVLNENKKALFYFNEGEFHNGVNDTEPNNVSFHFMYSEIDFFLNSIPKITNESDYEKYLLDTKGNLDFEIAEEFIYNNLIKVDQNLILKRNGSIDMKNDFPDTDWNKIVSESNMSEKFNGCTTMIYRVHEFPAGESSIMNPWQGNKTDKICVMSYNYKDQPVKRRIEIVFRDGNVINIEHNLNCKGAWSYHLFDTNVEKINVYENEKFIYEDKTDTSKNYIVLK